MKNEINTIKLYKITVTQAYMLDEQGTRMSLHPWEDNIDYKGFDDGGHDYILPDGYRLGETKYGELAIFDDKNSYCELDMLGQTPMLRTCNNSVVLNVLLKKFT